MGYIDRDNPIIQFTFIHSYVWQVPYDVGTDHVPDIRQHVGVVRMFASIPKPGVRGGDPLQLALVDFYRYRPPHGRALRAVGQLTTSFYPVEVNKIASKLVCAHPGRFMIGKDMFFMTYKSSDFEVAHADGAVTVSGGGTTNGQEHPRGVGEGEGEQEEVQHSPVRRNLIPDFLL